MKAVWGIDLGTTNSAVAEIAWENGDAAPVCRCLEIEQPTREGIFTGTLVPSVLAARPDGSHWVGEGAKRLRTRPQENDLEFERTLFYDTKNEMGLRKTYHRAAPEYGRAAAIAGHILSFLKQAAADTSGQAPSRVVVTVPASFGPAQRSDTLAAAAQAGLALQEHDLLDEPTAALLDYVFSHPEEEVVAEGETARGMVFDFGGGTCDVVVVALERARGEKELRARSLSVSRYHRLGGGDLDSAIVHERLLPDLARENGIEMRDLSWGQRKKLLEPQLLGTAEALKIALCDEITRLKAFGRFDDADPETVAAHQPPITCHLGKRELTLSHPALNAADWEAILEPFLDEDHLFARETEYRMSNSVFAPLQDALDRADLKAEELDFCLLVGGSTLIPQVREAVSAYLPNARLLLPGDFTAVQEAVARGAAWHAYYLEANGRPFLRPVAGETLALLVGQDDQLPLIARGEPLPYPADGTFARCDTLKVPDATTRELRLEIIAAGSRQPVLAEIWKLPPVVAAGDPLLLEYRLRGSGALECRAFLADDPDEPFECRAENPLVNVVSPSPVRLRIEALEEELRGRGQARPEDRDRWVELAECYAKLEQKEKAIDLLRSVLRVINRPDHLILNLQGLYYADLGDYRRAEKAYREAAQHSGNWAGPWFNLALSYIRQNRYADALSAVEAGLQREPNEAPYLTLRAQCLDSLGREGEAKSQYVSALNAYGGPTSMSDWELGWYLTCAEAVGNTKAAEKAKAERRRRARPDRTIDVSHAPRPERQ